MTFSRALSCGVFLLVAAALVAPTYAQWGALQRGDAVKRDAARRGAAQRGAAQRGAGQRPGPQAPPPEMFSATGTVEGVRRGQIKLKSTTDQLWIVNVGKATEVTVKGEADPEVLAARMWVRATMALDRKGRAKQPIAAMTIISRREDTVIGAFPVQTAGGFDAPAPDPAAASDPNATTDYDVVGMLTAAKKGKYTVKTRAGNQVVDIEFELAEDAKVDVNVDDYSLAKTGDEISVSGTILRQAQGQVKPGEITGIGNARTISIQLKEKIAPPSKGKRAKKKVPPRTSRRGRAGKSPDGESEKSEKSEGGRSDKEPEKDE